MKATIATQGLNIECTDPFEVWRVNTLMTKEEGTIRWLRQIESGEVLYDVGANIGLYSLLAVLQGARVVAFEPHVGNAARLLRNVALNKMQDRVTLVASALDARGGFQPFYYLRHNPGSSGSQLGAPRLEAGGEFTPAAQEYKHATTLDTLVGEGHLPAPTRIKVDVDGNEPAILRGARKVLGSPGLRSLQVEMHPASDTEIVSLLEEHGLTLVERHYTSNGLAAMAQGAAPAAIPHNAVFERAS